MEWKIFLLMSLLTVVQSADLPSVLILSHNHWFILRSPKNNCVLTDGVNKDSNGKLVMWYECTVTTYNAWWKAEESTHNPNLFTLTNKDSGLCLSVGHDLNDTGNDATVLQYPCQSNQPATQLWSVDIITVNHEHWVRLKSSGGRCLSYNPANNEIRGAMYMYDCGCCDRYTNQYFKLGWYNQN